MTACCRPRHGEPNEVPDELPEVVPKGFQLLEQRRGLTISTIARELGISLAMIEKVTGLQSKPVTVDEQRRIDNVVPFRRN